MVAVLEAPAVCFGRGNWEAAYVFECSLLIVLEVYGHEHKHFSSVSEGQGVELTHLNYKI